MARLSYQERKALPKRKFVFPGTRSFPIDTKRRARAALAEAAGARSGKPQSPARRMKIRAAVHRAYPGIKMSKMGALSGRHRG